MSIYIYFMYTCAGYSFNWKGPTIFVTVGFLWEVSCWGLHPTLQLYLTYHFLILLSVIIWETALVIWIIRLLTPLFATIMIWSFRTGDLTYYWFYITCELVFSSYPYVGLRDHFCNTYLRLTLSFVWYLFLLLVLFGILWSY